MPWGAKPEAGFPASFSHRERTRFDMPALEIPVWIWLNAVVLLAAAAFALGRLTGEGSAHDHSLNAHGAPIGARH